MNIFRQTACLGSFLVFNFISTTYPVNQTHIPLPKSKVFRLDQKSNEHQGLILGVKKEAVNKEESKATIKEKVFGYTQYGKVTYYGAPLHGHRTASGEIFDMNGLTTAAISSYPFGAILRVTNQSNGQQVEVRVTDRGGFEGYGVTLDLSQAAFAQIASLSQGVAWVKIDRLQ